MGQITKVLLLAFAIVLMAEPACAARITIRSCYDGDTCRTTDGERIRLACIDAPEMKPKPRFRATSMQAFAYDNTAALASRKALRLMVEGRVVGIKRITTDRYGRTVAELFVDGSNVQQRLVEAGLAQIDSRYAHQCPWAH